MRLSPRTLNRTLLHRQRLLERVPMAVPDLVRHLVGLQAQDTLPPYLSLHARLEAFDPYDVSRGLADRSLVRLPAMRGTIHLLTAEDALSLRAWTQPVHDRGRSYPTVRPAAALDPDDFASAVTDALGVGPLPVKRLGEVLSARFPEVPPGALGNLARIALPLAQLPPRGAWREPGGVVYQLVDRWVGSPVPTPDPADIVRRYLRSFGPASAADVTAWSGVTGIAAVVRAMGDLVEHEDERGKRLLDVPEGLLVDDETAAPVRLLGTYDNLWLSHAGRDRVTTPENRRRWMGANGGMASTVFVDGMLEGLWRVDGGRVVVEEFRELTRPERAGLADETERVEALLGR